MNLTVIVAVGLLVYMYSEYASIKDQLSRLTKRMAELETRFERTPEPVKEAPKEEEPKPGREPILPSPALYRRPATAMVPRSRPPAIDWERFMGVQLFAWLGGFALFLAAAFFVKYSIDHDLISPLTRVALGAMAGIGLIVAGLYLRRRGYATTVHSLCAAGVSILYADTFASRSVYNFIPAEAGFVLMSLITATSFLLAMRLDSRYVAVLGLLGGFLTPPLLSTGVDHPIALFSYVAVLDVGLMAVALNKNWAFLAVLSAIATSLMEWGWTLHFFNPAKMLTAAGIVIFFNAFYLAATELAGRRQSGNTMEAPAAFMPLASMGFVAYFLSYSILGRNPGLTLGLLIALSLQSAYQAFRRDAFRAWYVFAGLAAFALLAIWTKVYLVQDNLPWGLGYYFAFSVLHSVFPILLRRLRPGAQPFDWGYLAPLGMLAVLLMAMVAGEVMSFLLWPFVLWIGLIALFMAWLAGSLLSAGVSILLVMAAFGVWILRLPDLAGLPGILIILAFFACSMFAAALFMTGRRAPAIFGAWPALKSDPSLTELPLLAASMPFILLAMVCLHLPVKDPSQIFGLMALLDVLLLALVRYRASQASALTALAGTAVVEMIWHSAHYDPARPFPALPWYFIFYAAFGLFPYIFRKHMKGACPWIASAAAGPLHFFLVYKGIADTMGKAYIGAIPALFALPSLWAVRHHLHALAEEDPQRNTLVALAGAIALGFITLIIPVQFDKEWITLGWALEGAALIWLFQRVPHEGLKTWGAALLVVSFARLSLNPAVFSYHPRTVVPIFNWYLLVYGSVAASLLISARWLKEPRHLVGGGDVRSRLRGMAAILSFLLLNIEIADYFSTGAVVTFNFSASLAQDMTYSLGWAIFAIALLVIGIRSASQAARYGSLGLLLTTIVKVFLHDLWQLGQLYRVGSILGLAVILILVSFLYQKFLAPGKIEKERAHA